MMPDWAPILATYLLGVFLVISTLLLYLQGRGLKPGPVVLAAVAFIAGVAGILLAYLAALAAWGGGR